MSATVAERSRRRHATTAIGELPSDIGVTDVWLPESGGTEPPWSGGKLARPTLPSGVVARRRLSGLFNDGTARALTVVSAGPGWGKTLAAAAWAADTTAQVSWVSLDDRDGEPVKFWSAVVTAMRESGAVPPDNALTRLVPGQANSANLWHIADGLSRLPAPAVVVLDNLHEIGRSPVLDEINALLKHPIPQFRLVLLTRSDPTLALHRLRLHGDLAEIRAADLAFTADEAASMFALDGFDVTSLPLDRLLGRTEGWAAGLRFAALALRQQPAGVAIEELAPADRAAGDYLTDEVLAGLPPQMRTFLLHTSVAERINGPLANVLTAGRDGRRQLEQLVHANAFVVALAGAGHWYRYHPMLRAVLQHQLAMTEPGQVGSLHRRAAMWFAVHGSPIEAMQHAAAAEDWGLLGRVLVERAAPVLVSTGQAALAQILGQLADPDGQASAEVHLCAAARFFMAGKYDAMAPRLTLAREALPELDTETRPAADVLIHLLEHTVAGYNADTDGMIAHSSRALELLRGEAASVPAVDEYTAIATSLHGASLLWIGAFRPAERSLAEGLARLEGSGVELARISMLGHLGLVAAHTGRLRQAIGFATAAVELADSRGWSTAEQVSVAHLALALVHFRWNQLDEAGRELRLGLATGADQLPLTALRILQIRLYVARGRLARAQDDLTELRCDLTEWPPPQLLLRWVAIAEAELALARGEPDRAAELLAVPVGHQPPADEERVVLARAMLQARQTNRAEDLVAPLRDRDCGTAVDAWLITAFAADLRREDYRAFESLRRAVALAEPDGLRRPFAAMDPVRAARMLDRIVRLAASPSRFARELSGELRAQKDRPDDRPSASLTDRELVVLAHLPTMLSNAEIAGQMYISVNTIKVHLKALYRKLDVSNRRQAVRRAWELNLL